VWIKGSHLGSPAEICYANYIQLRCYGGLAPSVYLGPSARGAVSVADWGVGIIRNRLFYITPPSFAYAKSTSPYKGGEVMVERGCRATSAVAA